MNLDHCSFFPESIKGVYIGDCCERHDKRYERKTLLNRSEADILLYREVKRKELQITACVMYAGVRLVGWYWYDKT